MTLSSTTVTVLSTLNTYDNSCRDVRNEDNSQLKKWEYAQPQVTFAGFNLSQDGYSIDSAITDAIANFPTPSNCTNLRAFFGLANQAAACIETLAGLLGLLRPLLSTKNVFLWSPDHEQAFLATKSSLTVAPTLQFFFLTHRNPHATALMQADKGWVSSSY